MLDQVSQFKLSIQPDGTFTAEDAGLPESGSWQVVKDHAEFSVQKVMGQPVDGANNKPLITVTPQPDGTLLWKDPAGFDPDGLTLHKSQQPLTPVPTG